MIVLNWLRCMPVHIGTTKLALKEPLNIKI